MSAGISTLNTASKASVLLDANCGACGNVCVDGESCHGGLCMVCPD